MNKIISIRGKHLTFSSFEEEIDDDKKYINFYEASQAIGLSLQKADEELQKNYQISFTAVCLAVQGIGMSINNTPISYLAAENFIENIYGNPNGDSPQLYIQRGAFFSAWAAYCIQLLSENHSNAWFLEETQEALSDIIRQSCKTVTENYLILGGYLVINPKETQEDIGCCLMASFQDGANGIRDPFYGYGFTPC